MSTNLINPTNEGLTPEQFIKLKSGNVGTPQPNPTGVYYLLGGQPSYPPIGGKPFGRSYPTAGAQSQSKNYLNYAQISQNGFGQPIMPQLVIGLHYPGMNTI